MKTLYILFLLHIVLNPFLVKAQLTHEWHYRIGGNESDSYNGNLLDNQDNIYVMLEIADTTDIDPGPGVTTVVPQSEPWTMVLVKMNDQGELIWHRAFGAGYEGYGILSEVKHNQLLVSMYKEWPATSISPISTHYHFS